MKNNTVNTPTKSNAFPVAAKDTEASALTLRRLGEYGKRHNLTPEALKLVTYLYLMGPSGCNPIMESMGLSHEEFFAALCVARGLIILDDRAIRIDVNLTSRRAIAAIPESALQPMVGPRPSAGNPGGELASKSEVVAETTAKEEVADAQWPDVVGSGQGDASATMADLSSLAEEFASIPNTNPPSDPAQN
jgi:hypothetical protein